MPLVVPPPTRDGLTTHTPAPLYWAQYGVGDQPTVVLHGGPGAHHDYLLPQMLRLATSRALLFYDQRGGGRSKTESGEPITSQTHTSDLASLLAEFRLQSPTLIGYSWGGLLALLYSLHAAASDTAPLPKRLVLIDPAPISRLWRQAFEAEFQRRQAGPEIAALRHELAQSGLRESSPVSYRQRAFELSVAGYFANPLRAKDLTPFRVTGRVQQSVWDSLGDFDLLHQLTQLQIPALVTHGWHDPIPAESSFAIARALNARLVVLEHSGHVPYVEQPDTLFGAIEQFLQETASN